MELLLGQHKAPSLRVHKAYHSKSFERFFDHINACTGITLTNTEKQVISEIFKVRRLRRKEYFLQEGEICRYMCFISSGAMRMYSRDFRGYEYTMGFGIEHCWMSDYESYTLLEPTSYYIQTTEETELLVISYSQLQLLIDEIPAINKIIKLTDLGNLVAHQKHLHAVLSLTAEDRYLNMLSSRPHLVQRFSLHMIASYLGVTSETLSRIRRQSLRR